MSKFELINKDFVQNVNEIVPKLTREEKAYLKVQAKKVGLIEDKIDEALLKEGAGKIEWDDPTDGTHHTVTVVKTLGSTTTKTYEVIDYEKAVKYAKENNLHIPYLEPQVDINAIQNELWFQQNINLFKTTKEEVKTTKPTERVITK